MTQPLDLNLTRPLKITPLATAGGKVLNGGNEEVLRLEKYSEPSILPIDQSDGIFKFRWRRVTLWTTSANCVGVGKIRTRVTTFQIEGKSWSGFHLPIY